MTNGIFSPQGKFDGSKEAIVKDLKNVVADADAMISNVAQTTADEFAQARSRLEASLSHAKSRFVEAGTAVSGRARFAADQTDIFVRENPWKMLGIAAAAGLVIGAILSRR